MTVLKTRLLSSHSAIQKSLRSRLATLSGETVDNRARQSLVGDYLRDVPLTEGQEERAQESSKAQVLLAFMDERFSLDPSDKVIVFSEFRFVFDDGYHFSLLQSNAHEAWVRRNASTMRTDIRYTPSGCFETFPLPQQASAEARSRAGEIGGVYHERRRRLMLSRNRGLTDTYNLFNSRDCRNAGIARLRELHARMDRAIAACYDWQDLDLAHGFYPNERGKVRYTIAPEARRELLRRQLALNLELAAKEGGRSNTAVGKGGASD